MEQELLQEQKKPNTLAFQVAISFAIYTLILIVVMRILNIDPQAVNVPVWLTVLSIILSWATFIFAIFYAQNKHKKELGGFMTFGRAFSTGFRVSAYAGLFIAILMFVYYQFIDQAAITQMIDNAIAKANGNEAQIAGLGKMVGYMAILTAFSAGIMYTIVGLIVSLITGAIVKNDRPLHYTEPE
jgi:hypothetical protein